MLLHLKPFIKFLIY